MKRIATALIVFASLTATANVLQSQSSGKRLSADLIDRRDGRGPTVIEIAGDLWTQAKYEYNFGKSCQKPVVKGFYVAGSDASSR